MCSLTDPLLLPHYSLTVPLLLSMCSLTFPMCSLTVPLLFSMCSLTFPYVFPNCSLTVLYVFSMCAQTVPQPIPNRSLTVAMRFILILDTVEFSSDTFGLKIGFCIISAPLDLLAVGVTNLSHLAPVGVINVLRPLHFRCYECVTPCAVRKSSRHANYHNPRFVHDPDSNSVEAWRHRTTSAVP
jgi:hypothetical protein